MKSVKRWHDYKAFQLGGVAGGGCVNCSYSAMFKALLLPTTLVKPNFSEMLVTLPNIENNMTLSAL